jgi:isochorismate hydrolase
VVVNTRRIENLLGQQALGTLKAVFGGNPTEGERAILLELQGIGAKSLPERAEIMERLYEVLQDRQARETKRLDDILSGAYRSYEPLGGE